MITEWRIVETLAVRRLHGTDAARWTAERICALALAGDAAGVERFTAIATKVDRLPASAGRPC